MLTWNDIRAIDAVSDPIGVLSVYADGPDPAGGRLLRAVTLAGELRRLGHDVLREGGLDPVTAYREAVERMRPALVRALAAGGAGGRALFAPLSSSEVHELAVPLPVGVTVALEPTGYVRPLVAAFDEGRAAGLVVARRHGIQVLEWRMGAVEELAERHGNLPVATVTPAVRRVARERGWRRILVAGDAAVARALRDGDPGWEASAVTGWIDGLPPRALARTVATDLAAAQRRYERRLAQRVVGAALCDGTAVLGAPGTLDALAGGRAGHLLLDGERDYTWSGALAATAGRWPRRDPAEQLIELALAGGADITPLEGGARGLLSEADGVAAVLR